MCCIPWGVPAAELAPKVLARSDGSPTNWVTHDDFPAGGNGTAVSLLLFRSNDKGRVDTCRPMGKPTGKAFSSAGCTALMARARYRPVLNDAGAPMASCAFRRIIWIRPN